MARSTDADVEIAQALAAVAGLAIGNARLAEQTELRDRWRQAGTDMTTALLSGSDPDDVLRSVATRVTDLAAADLCAVLAPSADDDQSLTIVAAEGDRRGRRGGGAHPGAGQLRRLGAPRRLPAADRGHQHRGGASAGAPRRSWS